MTEPTAGCISVLYIPWLVAFLGVKFEGHLLSKHRAFDVEVNFKNSRCVKSSEWDIYDKYNYDANGMNIFN
jgi:hypothetical protein